MGKVRLKGKMAAEAQADGTLTVVADYTEKANRSILGWRRRVRRGTVQQAMSV